MSRSLKYGLNKPAAPTAKRRAALSIFANDDDEDVADGFVAGDGRGSVQAQLARQAQQRSSSSKIDPRHAQALAQDPTVFAYDEVYDDLKGTKAVERKVEKVERKSRYIDILKKKAELRNQEHEILYEKKLAKERATEDDQFGDKDKFVTSAYKKKLAERKAWEEEQRLLDEEDERNDVTKKTDFSGFFKNLFSKEAGTSESKPQQVGEEGTKQEVDEEEKNKEDKSETIPKDDQTAPKDDQAAPKDDQAAPKNSSVNVSDGHDSNNKEKPQVKVNEKRKLGEEAIKSARERYLERKRAKENDK